MKIANRLIVVSSLLLAAGCAHHDRQTNTGYSSTTYGAVGSSDRTGRYSSPSDTTTDTSGSFNSQSQRSTSSGGRVEGDASLTTQVQQSLKNDSSLASISSGIMVNAQNGTVTLTGNVPSEQDKQKIESMVKNTSGVVSVNNQIQVSLRPTSERQDQGSRIYHDSKDQGSTTSPGGAFDASKPPSTSDTSAAGTTGTSPTDQTSSGISSSTPSTPDQSNLGTSKSDLTASGTSSTGTPGTDASKSGVSGTSPTDVNGTADQSATPSSPTSDRPATRVYGQQDSSTSTASSDTAAAGSLSFNVQGTTEADKSVGRQVMQELRSDATFGAMLSQIKINVDSGKVTLKGTVKSEDQKKNAESIAQKVTGVSTIDNQLKVNAEASGTESK